MAKLLASGGTGFCGANLLIQHLWQACVDRRLGNAGDAICSSTFEVVAHPTLRRTDANREGCRLRFGWCVALWHCSAQPPIPTLRAWHSSRASCGSAGRTSSSAIGIRPRTQVQVGNGAGQSWQGRKRQASELELPSTTNAHDAHATLKAIVIHNASNTPQLAK